MRPYGRSRARSWAWSCSSVLASCAYPAHRGCAVSSGQRDDEGEARVGGGRVSVRQQPPPHTSHVLRRRRSRRVARRSADTAPAGRSARRGWISWTGMCTLPLQLQPQEQARAAPPGPAPHSRAAASSAARLGNDRGPARSVPVGPRISVAAAAAVGSPPGPTPAGRASPRAAWPVAGVVRARYVASRHVRLKKWPDPPSAGHRWRRSTTHSPAARRAASVGGVGTPHACATERPWPPCARGPRPKPQEQLGDERLHVLDRGRGWSTFSVPMVLRSAARRHRSSKPCVGSTATSVGEPGAPEGCCAGRGRRGSTAESGRRRSAAIRR